MTHNNFFDIHSHILFDVDDGPKEIAESMSLLRAEKEMGAKAVALTPHFYANRMELDPFVSLAKERFEVFKNDSRNCNVELVLGFEVAYFRNISRAEAITGLTYNNSKFLLLEMIPPLNEFAIEEVKELYYSFGLKPILAHLERYSKVNGYKNLLKLVEDGFVKAQVNASAFPDKTSRKEALNLIKNGYADFLASDTHSLGTRPPLFDTAFEIINNQLGEKTAEKLAENSRNLYCKITGQNWEY